MQNLLTRSQVLYQPRTLKSFLQEISSALLDTLKLSLSPTSLSLLEKPHLHKNWLSLEDL